MAARSQEKQTQSVRPALFAKDLPDWSNPISNGARVHQPDEDQRKFITISVYCSFLLSQLSQRGYEKSGRRDSNPRRPAWEADILPLNYARKKTHIFFCNKSIRFTCFLSTPLFWPNCAIIVQKLSENFSLLPVYTLFWMTRRRRNSGIKELDTSIHKKKRYKSVTSQSSPRRACLGQSRIGGDEHLFL